MGATLIDNYGGMIRQASDSVCGIRFWVATAVLPSGQVTERVGMIGDPACQNE